MKIHCTVKEFGQIVRACEKGSCYSCALKDICSAGPEDGCRIEDFIEADSIEKEGAE